MATSGISICPGSRGGSQGSIPRPRLVAKLRSCEQKACRKRAGSAPHSLPEHLFSFHHFSFWETGIKLYRRPQGEPIPAPAHPCHCGSACSGWLCWFLLWGHGFWQGWAGAGCRTGAPLKFSFSPGFPNRLYLQAQGL